MAIILGVGSCILTVLLCLGYTLTKRYDRIHIKRKLESSDPNCSELYLAANIKENSLAYETYYENEVAAPSPSNPKSFCNKHGDTSFNLSCDPDKYHSSDCPYEEETYVEPFSMTDDDDDDDEEDEENYQKYYHQNNRENYGEIQILDQRNVQTSFTEGNFCDMRCCQKSCNPQPYCYQVDNCNQCIQNSIEANQKACNVVSSEQHNKSFAESIVSTTTINCLCANFITTTTSGVTNCAQDNCQNAVIELKESINKKTPEFNLIQNSNSSSSKENTKQKILEIDKVDKFTLSTSKTNAIKNNTTLAIFTISPSNVNISDNNFLTSKILSP